MIRTFKPIYPKTDPNGRPNANSEYLEGTTEHLRWVAGMAGLATTLPIVLEQDDETNLWSFKLGETQKSSGLPQAILSYFLMGIAVGADIKNQQLDVAVQRQKVAKLFSGKG